MRIDKRARFRTRVNHRIRVPEVRVISEEDEQLGVMTTDKAIARALEVGLDLVEVSPTARPPVCRIMDYGQFKYEQNKRAKESKKKQHFVQVKEVKFRPKTEEHDYQFKKKHAEGFLKKLNKVKFTVIFRGRELDHKEMGMRILKRVAGELSEVGIVENSARFEGRLMTMMMAPLPAKPGSRPKKKDRGAKSATSPPRGRKGSPEETKSPPGTAESPPEETKSPPGTAESPPEEAKSPPSTAGSSPEEAKSPPGTAESPPEEAKSPPGTVESSVNDKSPPGDAGSPPGEAEGSPSEESPQVDAVDTNETGKASVEREGQNAEDEDEPRSEKEIS